jgi:transcriptional antiterminator NusG
MWYVIQVMTGKEDDTAGKLREQGIRALVPKENRLIRSGGTWKHKEYILFSGYVFLDMAYNAETYYMEAEWIMLLTGKDNAPIEPTVVRADGNGVLKAVKGVLEKFENRVIKYDKRSRKASFEITVCGEKKEVQLSIELEEDSGELEDAGKDAAGEAAQQALEYAT